jgi:3-phenylpropionate/trans-cinnamate dioxygenase ferredoxin reductase subunit
MAQHVRLEAVERKSMRVVIVGGGQAGGWVARTLRDTGFAGEVILLGEELHPPYQRPPLSKEVLLGEMEPEGCYLWPEGLSVDIRYGAQACRIDRTAKRLHLSGGAFIDYDRLVLATGGRVRRLDLPDVHYLRTIDDAMKLRLSLATAGSVLVVGGGWIGLEAAAVARKLGHDVTLVEATERLCVRVMPPVVSDYLHDLHARKGVKIHYRASAQDFRSDVVIAGIGIIPNDELALESGLAVNDGIVVDEYGRTSDPDIFAVGDVANLGGVRIESWANAQNQGIAAAKTIAGTPTPYRDIPWFWSNQYDVNLQFLGLPDPLSRTVLRGDPAQDCFSLFFLDEDNRISGVVSANAMRDLRAAKRMMERRVRVDPQSLADEACAMKDLLAAAAA